jgi:hypothetical protein
MTCEQYWQVAEKALQFLAVLSLSGITGWIGYMVGRKHDE